MIENILKDKKVILVCGSGGVGKTTVAASLAIQASSLGKKVVVLTIDPAKRLATSLGLKKLTSEPKKIETTLLKKVMGSSDGELYAMMLDTKHTFDQLVIKYSPSKDVENKILENRIYKQLSNMIAGSQEYMAMEKLYEIVEKEAYDLVIIDTPPTTHALEFLEAPEKMVNAISHSMIHLLLKPASLVGKSTLKIFAKGSELVLKMFDRIIGFAFLQEISEMLVSFQKLLGGFESRAKEVKEILMDSKTTFVLVAACEEKSIKEVELFTRKLSGLNYALSGVILNRVYPFYSISTKRQGENLDQLKKDVGAIMADKMMKSYYSCQTLAKRDKKYLEQIEKGAKKDQFVASIPLFETDIHDIEGLAQLSIYL